MHALGMIGKASKLANVVKDLTRDPGFNAAWTKYQQLSRQRGWRVMFQKSARPGRFFSYTVMQARSGLQSITCWRIR